MKTIEIAEWGVDALKVCERDDEPIGVLDVRVEIKAASLNYRDLLMVSGLYNPKQPLPLVPCSDGAGVVTEIGAEVSEFAVRDAVMSCFFRDYSSGEPTREKITTSVGGPFPGMLRTHAVIPESGLVKQPTGYTHQESATLPCAALTAWNALKLGRLQPGGNVLLQGTGGVSVFALQFASVMGANIFMTSSSNEKLERVRSMGAAETLNYKEHPRWSKQARAWTDNVGVDLVVEVGGAGTLGQSIRSVRPGGTIALIGVLAGGVSEIDIIPVLMQQIRIQGILVGHREGLVEMVSWIEKNEMKPVISDVFEFEKSTEAFLHLASGKHFGKVVINI